MGCRWRWRFRASWREGSGTTKEGGMWDQPRGQGSEAEQLWEGTPSISVPQFPQGELHMGRWRGKLHPYGRFTQLALPLCSMNTS